MAKVNKYGRQIFLSRDEIILLRNLVADRQIGVGDALSDSENLQTEVDEIVAELKKEADQLDKLIKKLWYYVEAEQEL